MTTTNTNTVLTDAHWETPPKTRPELPVRETLFRGARAAVETEQVQVSRDGGSAGAGLLSGVSLIAAGEALGHDMWVDETTLAQVSELANRGKRGVKSRFTHPSMSSDGMGRHLGRIQDVFVDGERVVGDLHFSEASHKTPDGDLAGYVLDLASEDPDAAGLSIVFEHDPDAEREFVSRHGGPTDFESPDPNNTKNLPHVRLSKLRAADIVDDPAANPDGLFDRSTLPRDVDQLLTYAAGLTEEKPTCLAFGVDAGRAAQFLDRWLVEHGLTLVPTDGVSPMSEHTVDAAPENETDARDEFLNELKRYTMRFGAEHGQLWFEQGLSFEQALEMYAVGLEDQVRELEEQLDEANEKLSSVVTGEDEAIETGAGETSQKFKFDDFFSSRN